MSPSGQPRKRLYTVEPTLTSGRPLCTFLPCCSLQTCLGFPCIRTEANTSSSCALCRKRKLRCNRETPCSNCLKSKTGSCVYETGVPDKRQVASNMTCDETFTDFVHLSSGLPHRLSHPSNRTLEAQHPGAYLAYPQAHPSQRPIPASTEVLSNLML